MHLALLCQCALHLLNIVIILHYMWVVGIDGCAPMNMTMVKNDMKNKEREKAFLSDIYEG